MKKLLTLSGIVLLASTSSFANQSRSTLSTLEQMFQTYQDIHSQVEAGDSSTVSKRSMDYQVSQGIELLREAHKDALADKFQNEWKEQIWPGIDDELAIGVNLSTVSDRELGDHPPLSPWLANFYETLNHETHGIAGSVQILSDINTLNYALAVVLYPNGAWRTHAIPGDRVEYRKHFIPMANIVTYWVTNEVCNYYANQNGIPDASDLCDYGAQLLEHEMGRYVAPVLSDEVWHMTTGEPIPPLGCRVPLMTLVEFQTAVMQHYHH